MRDRMERFVALPFAISCASQSSVAVGESQPKRAQPEVPPPAPPTVGREEDSQSSGKMKSSFPLPLLPRPPNISAGLQRIIKSFKSLSQIFVVYKEDDEDVEMEMEMEIGLPTDVQHVAHIGWDGFNSVGTMKSWEARASEFLPLPSLSLRQFELAMAAQADAPLAQCGPLGA